jgi:hypothetical protein
MDPLVILQIIEVATGLAKTALDGTRVSGDLATVAALEDLVAKVLAAHQAETGSPMDLSKFTVEDRNI